MSTEIAPLLRRCAGEVDEFSVSALAAFFALPQRHFSQAGESGPIVFHQAGLIQPGSYLLRGTIFWPDDKQIVRGYPRILPSSDYTPERFSMDQERRLFEAARDTEVVVERKYSGITIRLYRHGEHFYCATNDVYDGGNPLVGAGIESVRALGIDYGAQAAHLLESLYKGALNLAALGYVPVFEMLLPEISAAVPVHKPDMVMIDVIDPDYTFADRLEKERIAEDYGLKVVPSEGRLQAGAGEAAFFKRLRGLAHEAVREEIAGYVVKGRLEEGEQACLLVEPASVREYAPAIPESDLRAIYEALMEEFAPESLADALFAEELMLEYLGTRSRAARWRVQDFLAISREND